MKKKIYKLEGMKLNKGNLVVDGPIKDLGVRGRFELVKQLSEVQGDLSDFLEDRLDETKVTGKG